MRRLAILAALALAVGTVPLGCDTNDNNPVVTLTGPTAGTVHELMQFTVTIDSVGPAGVELMVYWDDWTSTDWVRVFQPCELPFSHAWDSAGVYSVRAVYRTDDSQQTRSTDSLAVTISPTLGWHVERYFTGLPSATSGDIGVSPDGRLACVGIYNGRNFAVIDLDSGRVSRAASMGWWEWECPKPLVFGAPASGNRIYASPFDDHDIAVIDAQSGDVIDTIPLPLEWGEGPTALAVAPSGDRLFVNGWREADPGNVLYEVSTATGAILDTVLAAWDGEPSAAGLCLTSDGRYLFACGGWELPPLVIRTSDNTVADTLAELGPGGYRCFRCAASPAGNTVCAANGTCLYFIEPSSESRVDSLRLQCNATALDICFTPDGREVLVCFGRFVQVYEVRARRLTATIEFPRACAEDIVYSRRLDRMLVADGDRIAILSR